MLVAISIPIFTSQLRKSRLATNQANARAAYAAAVAAQLDAASPTASATYTYTVSSAKIASGGTAATTNADITAWTVDTEIPTGTKLGDSVAKTWIISFDSTGGSVAGISATH